MMSLARVRLGSSAGLIVPHHRGFVGAWSRSAQLVRVVKYYPGFVVASSNQVAPPVGNVFGSSNPEEKEVNALQDPVGFVKGGLERNAQNVRLALESVEDAVAPSPYSPSEGTGAIFFVCLSGFLILAFWLGNYVVPTWIFKDTVFRNSNGNVEDEDEEEKKMRRSEEEDDVDPADLIELPTNLMPFRGAAVAGFKAGRQKARDSAAKWTKKKSGKRTRK